MKKLSNVLALVLSLALMLTLFTACGSSNSAAPTVETAADEPAAQEEAPAANAMTEMSQAGTTAAEDSGFQRQTEEGTLTVGALFDTDTFDPVSTSNKMGLALVYETLFYVDPDTSEVKGMLAESWEYQDDTHLYVKLRDDATFASGNPVTCEDVLWSWYRTVDEQGPDIQSFLFIDFDNTEIVNDKEMVIAFNYPFSPAVNYMCMPAWYVLDKGAMENASADDFWANPVGSGPYAVVENVSGTGATYELRADYWNADAMPSIEKIIVRNYGDPSTMFIDYETGALDVAFSISTVDAANVLAGGVADTNYKVLNDTNVVSLSFPEYTESLDDVNVRKALSLATDVAALVGVTWGDMAAATGSLIPTIVPNAVDFGLQEYDPEQAKELLAEAGYDESNPLVLSLVIVDSEANNSVATILQEQWAQVGVTLNVDSCDLMTAITHFMNSETDIALNETNGMTSFNPYEVLMMCSKDSSNSTISITDEGFNDAVQTGVSSVDEDVTAEAYAEAQTWIHDNFRRVPIAETYSVVVYRPYIANIHTFGGANSISVRWVDVA